MTQHTPGRLKLSFGKKPQWDYMINSAENVPIAYFAHYKPMTIKEGKANARRLVACWNRLEKFSTDDIENHAIDLTGHGALLAENIWLKSRNEELLEALKHIEGVAMADEWRDLPEIAKHARAAIAKVQGGEA